MKQHIESYPTMDSHYCRASSSRKYLDSRLTIKKMYEQFGEYFKQHVTDEGDKKIPSQKAYRDCFCTEFNLSFFHPKKDQCVVCAASRQGSNAVHAENSIDSVFEEHIRQKNLAQDEKIQDKEASCTDDTYVMATFDMQSILQLPTSELGPVYYKRKLVLHNFTIYEGKNQTRGFAICGQKLVVKEGPVKLVLVS